MPFFITLPLYIVAASGFIISQTKSYALKPIIKAFPILLLAFSILIGRNLLGPEHWLMLTALLFSAAG
ncbi:MAG: hypothetical protein AAGD96_21850, partial [Chloroflexota bacterium]